MQRLLTMLKRVGIGRGLVLGGMAAALFVGSFAAYAYVRTSGEGSGTTKAGQFAASTLDHFTVTAAAGTQTAGTPFSVTVTAAGQSGGVVTGYTGTITFSSNDPAAAFPNGGTYTFTAGDAGTHTFTEPANGVTLTTAGSGKTVAVADGAATGEASFTVDAGAATKIVLTGDAADLASGAQRTFTATIEDAAGNTVTSGADSTTSVTFANPGPGTLTGLGATAAVAGVASQTVTGSLAGAVSLQASATLSAPAGATSSNTLSLNVVAGAATQIVLTGDNSDLVAGTTRDFTATIADAAGNTVTSGPDGTIDVTFAKTNNGAASVTGLGTFPAVNGVIAATLTGGIAGTIKLKASGTLSGPGAVSSSTITFSVVVGPAAQINLTGSAADLASASTRTYTATVEDAGGNPIVTGPDSTIDITFAKTNSTNASVTGLATVTAVAGVATDTITAVVAGTMKVAASGTLSGPGAVTSNTKTFDVVFGPTAQIELTGGQANLTAGNTRTYTATVEDAAGNAVTAGPDSTVSMTFAQTGTGTVTGLTTVTAVAGVATDDVTGALIGTVNIQASAPLSVGATSSNTKTFDVVTGDATQIVLSGDTTDLAAGAPRTFTATVEDVAGNTITTGGDKDIKITFSNTGAGTGTVTGLGKLNAVLGVAPMPVNGGLQGSVSLQASGTLSGPGAVTSNTLTFNVVSGPASQIKLSGDNSDLVSGTQRTFTATVQDAGGNLVVTGPDSTIDITFAKTNSTNASVTGLATVTAVAGVATNTVTGVVAGTMKVAASGTLSGPGAVSSNTKTFDVVFGPATQIALTGSLQDLASGSTRTYTATVEDANGNAVTTGPDSTIDVTFAKTNGTNSSVSGLATVPAVAGVATVDLTGVIAGTIKLGASGTLSGPGAVASNTKTFEVIAGPAAQVALTGSSNNLQGGNTRTYTATIEDAAGNTVTAAPDVTANITFAATAGPGTVTGLTTVAAVAGVATDVVTGGLAGAVTLQASATLSAPAGAVNSNPISITVTVGSASQIVLTGSTSDLVAGAASTYTATIVDGGGNTVTTNTAKVTFAQTAGTGTVTNLTKPNAVSGVATDAVNGGVAGPVTLQASATLGGNTVNSNSLSFNVVVGPVSQLVFTTQPGGAAPATVFTTQPVVAAEDSVGNIVTSYAGVITLTKQSGTGALSGCAGTLSAGATTYTGCKVSLAGASFKIKATDNSATPLTVNSAAFNVAGPLSKLTFKTSPGGTLTHGTPFGTQPVVEAQDASGVPVGSFTGTVTLSITGSPAGVNLTGCTATPPTNGISTAFAGCTIDVAGTYTLTASDGNGHTGVSTSFVVT